MRTTQFKHSLLWGTSLGLIIGIVVYCGTTAIHVRFSGSDEPISDSIKTALGTTTSVQYPSETDFRVLIQNHSVSMRQLFDVITNTDLDTLSVIANDLANLDHTDRIATITTLVIGQITRKQPKQALNIVRNFPDSHQHVLVGVIFGEWATLDLHEAVRAAKELNWSLKKIATAALLTEREDLEYSEVMQVASNLGLKSFVHTLIQESKAMQLKNQPQQTWDMLVQDGIDDNIQRELLSNLVIDLYEEKGVEVLPQIFENLSRDYTLYRNLLNSAVAKDPSSAFRFVQNMSAEEQELFLPELMRSWAMFEPEEAFHATSAVSSSNTRSRSRTQILDTWAQSNPLAVLEFLPNVPDSIKHKPVQVAIRELARRNPTDAVKQLNLVQQTLGTIHENTEFALVEEWAEHDAKSALEWVKTNSEKDSIKRSRMVQRVVSKYALVNPEEAMRIARNEPPNDFHGGLETYVIRALVTHDRLDKALELLETVSEHQQVSSYRTVGRVLVQSNRSDDAVDIAQRLSGTDKSKYFAALVPPWMAYKPQELLDRLPSMPTDDIKSNVALEILKLIEIREVILTNAEVAFVKSFVQVKDEEIHSR